MHLEVDRVLPPGWLAAANDGDRQAAFAAAARHLAGNAAAAGAAGGDGEGAGTLWCVGGLGVEALHLAAAAAAAAAAAREAATAADGEAAAAGGGTEADSSEG
jgi:hypothetical protein